MAERRGARAGAGGGAGTGAPDVRALEDSYRVVGEVRGTPGAMGRRYLGTRRDDGTEVVISVLSAPGGGANNELSHFAADVQLLTPLSHPALVRVLESRWLGPGTLAVVTERVHGTTLAESIRSVGAFSSPRTAAVLQEVWGVIDWARSSGVVHRGVTPDNVYIEPGTQRVRVALGPTAIPIEGVNDTRGDARTVASLAWLMLTGKPWATDAGSAPLEQLAPNLALRVADSTEAMLHGADGGDGVPDAPTYIGLVAAGDVLKQAEVELAAMKEDYEEQHRIALAQCENHRQETERMAAEQADLLARERADFERAMTSHQDQLTSVRDDLAHQAAALDQRIAEFERARAEITRLRMEQENTLAAERQRRDASAADSKGEIARKEREAMRREPQDLRRIVGVGPAPVRHPTAATAPPTEARRRHRLATAVIAVVLLAAAVVAGFFYRDRVTAEAQRMAAGRPSVAPPRRTAAGSVVPGAYVPAPVQRPGSLTAPAAMPVDTMGAAGVGVAAPADPPPVSTPPITRSRPQSQPQRPAGGGGASGAATVPVSPDPAPGVTPTTPAPVTSPSDSARAGSMWMRTDSVIRLDNSSRSDAIRDSLMRGLLRIDSSRMNRTRDAVVDPVNQNPVDSVRLDSLRSDAARRDSAARRGPGLPRPDTSAVVPPAAGRVGPDSLGRVGAPGPPGPPR